MGSAEPLGEKWPADSFGKVHPSERNKWVGIFFLLFFLVEVETVASFLVDSAVR